MSIRVTELSFLKYFAPCYDLPAPKFIEATEKRKEIKNALDKWNGKAIIKPDVLSGKRAKSNAIVEVNNVQDAIIQIKKISNTEICGHMPRTSYLVEYIPAQLEIFTAITYNSSLLGPTFTISLNGGIDIEDIPDYQKITIPIDIFKGLDAYQISEALAALKCPRHFISILSRTFISFWDLFISAGMISAEINPWRITPKGKPYACDFKATIDETNYKSKIPGLEFPEYPENVTQFEEEMKTWNSLSHQGQAHVSELGGKKILPILFGGGVSTIVTETLKITNGDPMFLSDFGGNPPYERMFGTAKRCFNYKLKDAKCLLILGGNANNTFIDITFQAIGDALINYVEENQQIDIPVVVGRGGPRLSKGMLYLKQALDFLDLSYVMFGPDTPVTLVAEYASKLTNAIS